MTATYDKEILNASRAIDKALARMNKENRGETAVNIVTVVRNLNDNIAFKIWQEVRPGQAMGINKVASQFVSIRPYQFIGRFNKFLQKAVSHFTPSEDGAERLLIKYYRYLLELKKIMHDRYSVDIIENIDCFLEDIDEQTKDYYTKVAAQIKALSNNEYSSEFDNYYINRIKPFYINHDIFYEVTLEPAEEKPNKFNRITAFTAHDISTNYSVALRFIEKQINVFGVNFPIKIIVDWEVSIRPCEIINFARIFRQNIKMARNYNEYKSLMQLLKDEQYSLVDIIDLPNQDYNKVKEIITISTRNNHSVICDILDECRKISLRKNIGANILRYLLNRMNNRIIKLQWPLDPNRCLSDFYLSSRCMAFEMKPYSFNPQGHVSNFYDLLDCIDTDGRDSELLARHIKNNTEQNGVLFTPISELQYFGNINEIKELINNYNESLYYKFRPEAELAIYGEYVYIKEYESGLVHIINELKILSSQATARADDFTTEKVSTLKTISNVKERLDDPLKESILTNMFSQSRVHLVYGAAGTGKSTLINHIAKLTKGRCAFLAKTNPAKENLKRKVIHKRDNDIFATIDSFTKSSRYDYYDFDMIVVDECSTVKNTEVLSIMEKLGRGVLVLVGDVYQIESIGYGSWFGIVRNYLPKYCCHELTTPYRSTDEGLKALWKEVRNMAEDNIVLEELVRNEYSHIVDDNIFAQKAEDEIILCLNYNGLYGLNNINRLMQLRNRNRAVGIGVWQFKEGDPILFNDSDRFAVLFNNLKGRIIRIEDNDFAVKFTVEVDMVLAKDEVECCEGLAFISNSDKSTIVSFNVSRRPPYSSDMESEEKEHIMPFQVAYAVSIHKSQGLEYDSVKIVISNDSEDRITHNVFYTAITRAREKLTLYWSPEVSNRILKNIRPKKTNKDNDIICRKHSL